MTIEKTIENGAAVFALKGRLDTVTSPELNQAFQESLPEIQSLTLDLQDLEYISSAGLRALLSAHKALMHRGGMTLIHVGETVQEVFEITGFADTLTIR